MLRKKKAKKRSLPKPSHWGWDALAITIAITLGFGPYALLSIFGTSQVKEMIFAVPKARLPAADNSQ